MKSKPIRMCVYTRTKSYKENMIRMVKNDKNIYVVDKEQKAQKRAIYVYPCKEVLKHIEKNKKYNISEDAKEYIINTVKVGEGVE